jgi:hypothetical protein
LREHIREGAASINPELPACHVEILCS